MNNRNPTFVPAHIFIRLRINNLKKTKYHSSSQLMVITIYVVSFYFLLVPVEERQIKIYKTIFFKKNCNLKIHN